METLLPLAEVRRAVAAALDPGRFFLATDWQLDFTPECTQEIPWELFHGRLLGENQTRQRQSFQGWEVFATDAAGQRQGPLLAVLLDPAVPCLHVTRSIHSYVWEGYDAGDNVFRSREVQRWVRELVTTLDLHRYADAERLTADLGQALFRAVVGLSRLPLTSIEAPLPCFTLGKLGYVSFVQPGVAPRRIDPNAVPIAAEGTGLEHVKLLELLLRGCPDANELASVWGQCPAAEVPAKVVALFDEVALSPWTDFVERTLRFVTVLLPPTEQVDLLGVLLRRIARHLTAFDLVTFHHRGANYPDALLLDAVLKAYLQLAEVHPDLFTTGTEATLRRRALRQGWLLRCRYEGHAVPAVPTSPGENQRVLPAEFPHLDDQDIVDPARRTQQLFADDPLDAQLTPALRALLAASIQDLEQPAELRELGTALFLDRPLGIGRHPTEPDQTTLLSYIAFSEKIATDRLKLLVQRNLIPAVAPYRPALDTLAQEGVALERQPLPARAGVPSLQDAFRIAPDFRLRATTRRSVADFLDCYDLSPLEKYLSLDWLRGGQRVLIIGGGASADQQPTALTLLDAAGQRRVEFDYDPRAGYQRVVVREFPAQGLRLRRTWEKTDFGWHERRWDGEDIRVVGRR